LIAFLEITYGRQEKMSNMWNLFWIFIVIVSVMPLLQQKMMQAKRFALIRKPIPYKRPVKGRKRIDFLLWQSAKLRRVEKVIVLIKE
jgi:hypothetical protein